MKGIKGLGGAAGGGIKRAVVKPKVGGLAGLGGGGAGLAAKKPIESKPVVDQAKPPEEEE